MIKFKRSRLTQSVDFRDKNLRMSARMFAGIITKKPLYNKG